MGGRIRARALFAGALLSLGWTQNALGQAPVAPAAAVPTTPAPTAAPTTPAPAPAVAPAVPPPRSSTAAFPAPTPAPAAPPTEPAPPPLAPVPRKAVVRFQANEQGALLESDTTADGRTVPWYVVCLAPCTATVSQQGALRVGGWGYHPSRPFRVPDGRAELAVDAEMERSSLALPIALTVSGGTIASFGGLLVLGGFSEEQQHRDGQDYIVAGSIIGGTGLVVAMVGIVILLVESQDTESRTHLAEASRGLKF